MIFDELGKIHEKLGFKKQGFRYFNPIQQLKPPGITFFGKKIIFQREGNDIRKYTPLNKEGREKR